MLLLLLTEFFCKHMVATALVYMLVLESRTLRVKLSNVN